MPRDWKQFLNDMLEAANRAIEFSEGRSAAQLIQDKRSLAAITHEIQIIGEAAKRIPSQVTRMASDIPWKQICGMRDMLVHEYFNTREGLIIDVCLHEIPKLISQLQTLKITIEKLRLEV